MATAPRGARLSDAPWPPVGPEPEPERYRDQFDRLIDRSPAPSRLWRRTVPLIGLLCLAAVGVVTYLRFGTGGSDPIGSPSDAMCPAQRVGDQIQGNGVGGFDSGPAVIFAFQHAYYVARSGDRVRAATTADAAVQTADTIQRGIDAIPQGTTHCVYITPSAHAGQYVVVVTERRPGQPPVEYNPQVVTTTMAGGRTLISAIAHE